MVDHNIDNMFLSKNITMTDIWRAKSEGIKHVFDQEIVSFDIFSLPSFLSSDPSLSFC